MNKRGGGGVVVGVHLLSMSRATRPVKPNAVVW